MYGTPWHGDGGLASPMRFPIKKIFILKKAKQNYIKPISESLAVSRLLVRGFLPLWDAEKIDLSLKFLEELNQEIDVSELGFLPDPSIIDFIQKLT
jgi:hypothetical protein